jgi:hypothetical protein
MCAIVLSFFYGNITVFFVYIEYFRYVRVVGDGDAMVFEDFFGNLIKIDKWNTVFCEVFILAPEI